jgi:hypothetical protein
MDDAATEGNLIRLLGASERPVWNGRAARCKKARPDDGDHDERELHSDEVP